VLGCAIVVVVWCVDALFVLPCITSVRTRGGLVVVALLVAVAVVVFVSVVFAVVVVVAVVVCCVFECICVCRCLCPCSRFVYTCFHVVVSSLCCCGLGHRQIGVCIFVQAGMRSW
jgi:hypothetical protein